MSAPDATVTTTTTVQTDDDPHDGLLPEPTRQDARWLWYVLVITLCAILVAFGAVFVLLAFRPSDPPASIDAATLVGLFGLVLAALLGLYSNRQRR